MPGPDHELNENKPVPGAALDFDQVVALIRSRPDLRWVAIDGLPVAGKSTLAERLVHATQAQCLYLDDFMRPQAEWPCDIAPAFPFPFIRYDEFLAAVNAVVTLGRCEYRTYDWERKALADEPRVIEATGPVIIEGVTSLHPALTELYHLRLWVESDAETMLRASRARGVGSWDREWQELFLPSVELYLKTNPKARADLAVAGRGY